MIIRESIVTDTGIIIDPDDDVEIVEHRGMIEIIYDDGVHYCHDIQEYNDN